MKQLVCEMCGNTDLIKQDGVFVCQSCGCKYSVEEAKKMMVSVEGQVQVADMAKLTNILKLAQSSFDSKNYKQAEEFCNQAIAIDSTSYSVWKLKGEAINYQINTNNPRIQEVYDCIIMSYNVLSDSEKDEHRDEILKSLKTCFEGEVDFWLKNIIKNRPSTETVKQAENAYVDSWNKMKSAFEILGYNKETKEAYLANLDDYFVKRANVNGVKTWDDVVYYNYARGNYRGGKWINDDYRPSDAILSTFISETDALIELMHYTEKQFNETTPLRMKKATYNNIVVFNSDVMNAQSFVRMQSSTRIGYAGIGTTLHNEYWKFSKSLTSEAKQIRQKEINNYNARIAELKVLMEKEEADKKAEKARIEKEESQKRFNDYWTENAELKKKLENEKSSLQKQIADYNQKIDFLPEGSAVKDLEEKLSALQKEKDEIGMFKIKEKKALQEKIDEMNQRLSEAKEAYNIVVAPLNDSISKASSRVSEIDIELTKAR